ncbi:hypothetical protein [Sulfobacillus thermosulfidooxidans]|uniref:hypothetical protein n=1 Tax=Sulfobacillus thermosulfidooxidans TaxID=28034 RepID=UPI000490014F|nr:hypothetical protein [Sulfobacillus thermosulfidooxidans]
MKKFWNRRFGKPLTISVIIAGLSIIVLNLNSLFQPVHIAHHSSSLLNTKHPLVTDPVSKASPDYLSFVVPEKDFTITEHAHQGMATWIMPVKPPLTSGTEVVLWGWPNATLATYRHQSPQILGKTTVKRDSRTLSIIFALPRSWPSVHEVFQMEVIEPNHPNLKSPPYGQLPEVPWAALLPFIVLAGFGFKFYHNGKKSPSA